MSSSSCSSLLSIFTSTLLRPNILLNARFSYTLGQRSFHSGATKFHTHTKQQAKKIVLCILIFKLLDSKLGDKRFCTEWKQAFSDFNLPLISSWIEFWFAKVVPKHLNSSILSKEPLLIFIFWTRLAFWSRDMTMHSAFTSSPISYLATTKPFDFFFILYIYVPFRPI